MIPHAWVEYYIYEQNSQKWVNERTHTSNVLAIINATVNSAKSATSDGTFDDELSRINLPFLPPDRSTSSTATAAAGVNGSR